MSSDMILGDNVLRSMYSVYNFGNYDTSGNMGAPHVQFLSIVDPNQASKEFAAARGTVARTNITYTAANLTLAASTTVSLSDDLTNTLNKINTYFPIMLAILGLNAVVILLLAIAAFIYLFRRRRNGPLVRNRRNARPLQLDVMSTDTFTPPFTPPSGPMQRGTMHHSYQPVSMALSEDTFVPPSPAFHQGGSGGSKARSFDDRPNSVA
jgi:saccharopepsin